MVTGGSRGIGRAVLERLARDGARVAFGYTSDHQGARAVQRSVDAVGGTARGVRADLRTDDGVRALIDGAETYLEGLDLLVNNAAAPFTPGPLADADPGEYDRIMAVKHPRGVPADPPRRPADERRRPDRHDLQPEHRLARGGHRALDREQGRG